MWSRRKGADPTHRVDYDRVAPGYDARYRRNNYSGVEQALAAFVEGLRAPRHRVLEVGCGTGHWLRRLGDSAVAVFGVDLSAGMLKVAHDAAPGRVTRGRAEQLPYASESCDRLFCVNALHHFSDQSAFFREARRVLRDAGVLLTIGLDPHNGEDQWWVYDYFPSALVEDRRRYLPTAGIRELMEAAGFSQCETRIIQHLPRELTIAEAKARGFLDRTSTSQMMVIPDGEYEAGLQRILAADTAAQNPRILRSDLRLYATVGSIADAS